MKIKEISIDGFGKFHKYHCKLSDGIQVFYGENESGKTTLRKFMIAMLFGMEKGRGMAAKNDDYTKYVPIDGGNYGGSMIFEKDGISYRVQRIFSPGRSQVRLFYSDTMEEIILPEKSLVHKIFESNKNAFENTVSMTQSDIRTGKEMKEVLQSSMANLRSSKDSEIDIRKAIDYLKAKRREKRKDSIFAKADKIRQQIKIVTYDPNKLEQYTKEEQELRKKLTKREHYNFFQRLLRWIRRLLGVNEDQIEKMEILHRLDIVRMEIKQLTDQKEMQQEIHLQYQKIMEQKKSIEEEIRQIEMAIYAIEQAALAVQKTFGQELNEKISEIFEQMTGSDYKKVVMNDALEMMVQKDFDYIDMKYLSNATVEQLYFALRLAAADLLYKEDHFPLFLDDVFGNYDDKRLKRTLSYLGQKSDRQIFLFTGRSEVVKVLKEHKMNYHLIAL